MRVRHADPSDFATNPESIVDNRDFHLKRVRHKCPVTILVRNLADQAAMDGVLNTFFDMHLTLLSVENLNEPEL